MSKVEIIWLGHACFQVRWGTYHFVIDPYEDDYVPGLAPLRTFADQVFYSHQHQDHYGQEQVLKRMSAESLAEMPFRVELLSCWHDEQNGALRGTNQIHIFDDGEYRVAHMGDLGGQLQPDQLERLKHLDALMIPVGGCYTIDAGQAKALVGQLQPRVVIPMHYRNEQFGFETIGTLADYTALCHDVITYQTNQLNLQKDLPVHTAILSYQVDGQNRRQNND